MEFIVSVIEHRERRYLIEAENKKEAEEIFLRAAALGEKPTAWDTRDKPDNGKISVTKG